MITHQDPNTGLIIEGWGVLLKREVILCRGRYHSGLNMAGPDQRLVINSNVFDS